MVDTPPLFRESLQLAANALAPCARLLVVTGAGLSADAGVPTFRGEGGLYTDEKVAWLASGQGFAADPDAVWDWYRLRREQIASCQPHAGQRCLALLQTFLPPPNRVLVVTTNEDDLLERAGLDDVVHLHGNLFDTICSDHCGWWTHDDLDNAASFVDCPSCGAATRPGSVWFGENLPACVIDRITDFEPDGCLVVGSSSLVSPVAEIPPELLMEGRPVVEVNPAKTPLSDSVTAFLQGRAVEVLPALVDLMTSSVVREQSGCGGDAL